MLRLAPWPGRAPPALLLVSGLAVTRSGHGLLHIDWHTAGPRAMKPSDGRMCLPTAAGVGVPTPL